MTMILVEQFLCTCMIGNNMYISAIIISLLIHTTPLLRSILLILRKCYSTHIRHRKLGIKSRSFLLRCSVRDRRSRCHVGMRAGAAQPQPQPHVMESSDVHIRNYLYVRRSATNSSYLHTINITIITLRAAWSGCSCSR